MISYMNKKAEIKDADSIFILERNFPIIDHIFSAQKELISTDQSCLIILDTNVLLLPYASEQLGKKDITEIEKLLTTLKRENRVMIPERVAREFIKNRDIKLADLVKSLNDKKSRISAPESELSKLFQYTNNFTELGEFSSQINELIKKYKKSYSQMVDEVKSWRGDDPITKIYEKIFNRNSIISFPLSEEDAMNEWDYRQVLKCPPGYKDASKEDSGIGDFIIWKSLINVAKEKQMDVIFVTGDQKSDWYVRSDKEAIFVRPELIDEFRRETSRHIRLIKFEELLTEYNVSPDTVNGVKKAELNRSFKLNPAIFPDVVHTAGFDYSQNNGEITVEDKGIEFDLRFSKADKESIHIYSTQDCKISRLKKIRSSTVISINDYDNSSFAYTIKLDEYFMYKKSNNDVLIGKILKIENDSRGDSDDYVEFSYVVYKNARMVLVP